METPIGNSTEKPTRVVSGYGATRPEAFHKFFIRQLEREIQRGTPPQSSRGDRYYKKFAFE